MHREPASEAAFLHNRAGHVCIALSDPAYVHSDMIVVDCGALNVFAVMHGDAHFLGQISCNMADAFSHNDHVLLYARKGDGSIFELHAPVSVRGNNDMQEGESA